MKQNLRDEALSAVLPKITEMFPDAVNVCVSNKNMLAVDTGKVDDNGNPIYATIDVTIKDNEATKTREGFDLMTAVNAYASIMARTADLSGVIPQISVVLGPCGGGAAMCAAMFLKAASRKAKNCSSAILSFWMDFPSADS